MNSKNIDSLGDVLVRARKSLNLSKQYIANKLCVKLDVIDNIEKNLLPDDILPVFFCGYIRSYARLVGIKDKKLFKYLDEYKFCNFYYNRKLKSICYENVNKEFSYISFCILIKSMFFIIFNWFLN